MQNLKELKIQIGQKMIKTHLCATILAWFWLMHTSSNLIFLISQQFSWVKWAIITRARLLNQYLSLSGYLKVFLKFWAQNHIHNSLCDLYHKWGLFKNGVVIFNSKRITFSLVLTKNSPLFLFNWLVTSQKWFLLFLKF